MRPLRIASLNAYLICDVFNNHRRTHPEKRASRIRSAFLGPAAAAAASASSNESVARETIRAKPGGTESRLAPDLCFFQEVWGSGIGELTRGVDRSIPPGRSSSLLASGVLRLAKRCVDNGNGNGSDGGDGDARWGAAVAAAALSRLGELIDTFRFHRQRTGGLFDASGPSLSCLYRRKHTFRVSRSRSLKGVEATLWDVPQWNDEPPERSGGATGGTAECASASPSQRRQLLVFNTHLDPWHPSNRRQQIAEIAGFMEETLRSIEDDSRGVGDLSSRFEFPFPFADRGGGDDPRKRSGRDWSRTAVLVVGDFNIKAGSDEYNDAFSRGGARDDGPRSGWIDWFASDSESESESETDDGDGDGDGDHRPERHTYALRNSLVEHPGDCGRIDYIFGIPRLDDDDDDDDDDRTTTTTKTGVDRHRSAHRSESGGEPQGPPRSRVFLPLTVVSRRIRTEPIGEESSDHYALIVELIPSADTRT